MASVPVRRPHPVVLGLLVTAACTALVAGFASSYVLFLLTGAAITTVFMQSYGLITGRAGVISLCQLSFAALGAWVVGWANVADVPGGFYVWLPLGGLAAVVAGLVIALPALRLRGMSLAVATFAFATALDVVFRGVPYPGLDKYDLVRRPDGFTDDAGYFVFTVAVVAAIFVGLRYLDRSRAGGALVEIRHSERAAAAHGISVAKGKLTAFALSAFVAGVGGGLLAGQLGFVSAGNFASFASVTFFAIALFVGTNNVEGAIAGGVLGVVFPVLLDAVGVPQDLSALFFGIGAVQVLRLGASQTDLIRAARRRRKAAAGPRRVTAVVVPEAPPRWPRDPHAPAALEVRGLTVRFGALTAVDHVDLVLPKGHIVGLVGPNGAGKSTLINTITGFTDRYEGQVLLGDRPVDRLPAHLRSRAGLRRSFQQLRVPTALTVGMFLQVAAGRTLTARETDEQLALFRCPDADVPMELVDVATRRLLEVAGLSLGAPPVLLLDEPAAGHSGAETHLLQRRLAEIPDRFDTSVLLVEHDIELVRSTCDSVVVMDFGRVIASGPPDDVLSDPAVVTAYLGTATH
ncbi:ATP-binding cassette domain-containing protein [Actinosynnema sp. NPDC020468]|uniref:branched-chain amino acid ABC transporter ATP-binding protein/permease n=1 Tax=Actinosynnema sp. NPDC020468 TaxID=3154488 RepID=UPI0033CF90A2